MPPPPGTQLYRGLAEAYERLGQPTMRDRFLMLAADAALQAGDANEAERLRQRLLTGSRHHMLRPYASFAEAAATPDVQTYLRDLRLNYPQDVAEQMLASLSGNPPTPARRPEPTPAAMPPSRTNTGSHRSENVPTTAPLIDTSAPVVPHAQPVASLPAAYPLAETLPPLRRDPPTSNTASSRPTAPTRSVNIPRSPTTKRTPRNEAPWLNILLAFVVLIIGIGVAAVTLGRPFFLERMR